MDWTRLTLSFGFLMVNIGGFGLTVRIVRKNLTDFKTDITKMAERQNECRESLPERFADKSNTRTDIKELFTRTDEQGRTLAQLKGRLNGANA